MRDDILRFGGAVSVLASASVVGRDEWCGPIGRYFDRYSDDLYFSQPTWEQAETEMIRQTYELLLKRGSVRMEDIGAVFAGDLLDQCVATGFSFSNAHVPYFGLYGACSTAAESLLLGSIFVSGGFGRYALAAASSHFCTSERQFRFPVEYAGQRSPTSQQTVTGCGAFLLGAGDGLPTIREAVIGRVVDKGITDANNMGAAMAPAVLDTILRYVKSGGDIDSVGMIVTGDLAFEGCEILSTLLRLEGLELKDKLNDCGMIIFDRNHQDVHSGGSGCGCSAVVLASYLLKKLERGKDILFIGTGAMLSPLTVAQKRSIPSVAHLLRIGVD